MTQDPISVEGRLELPGSSAPKPAAELRALAPEAPVEHLMLLLHGRIDDAELERRAYALAATPPRQRRYPEAETLFAEHHPGDDALAAVKRFAERHGLRVGRVRAGCFVSLSGTAADVNAAFAVQLEASSDGRYLHHQGPASIPADLARVVRSVHGLCRHPATRHEPEASASASTLDGNFPPQVAGYYDFPTPSTPGSRQTIALYESNLDIYLPDVQTYFATYIQQPMPSVTAAAGSFTGRSTGQSREAMLDIEIAGSIALDADIVVYAGNQYGGMLQAIVAAIEDGVDVMSISYGHPESTWSADDLAAITLAFWLGGQLGTTFCVSSGDSGAPGNQAGDQVNNLAFPASSPAALACGGTELILEQDGDERTLVDEVVWNTGGKGATGGGISAYFPAPSYQGAADLPASVDVDPILGRGVPDVGANASGRSGYAIYRDGTLVNRAAGTSCAAPLWAALVAILNAELGTNVGFLTPTLYDLQLGPSQTTVCRLITEGNNGTPVNPNAIFYASSTTNWNSCCGLGSPLGNALLTALQAD